MHNEVLEDLVVVKRSGQRVSFNASKVAIAIKKAFDGVGKADEKKIFKIFEKVLTFINDNYKDRKTINVEDIQDIVENTLYNEKCYSVYNAFKEYRQKRALSRKVFAEKQQHKFVKSIEKIEENALNKDNKKGADDLIYDFGKTIASEYTKSYILDTKSVRASEEGNIYIHDLDFFSLGMFPKVHLKLERKLVDDYDIDILINEILNVEREVYNEIEINNIDSLLKPYLLKKYKLNLISNLKKYFKILGFTELINTKKIEEYINSQVEINSDINQYNQFIVNDQIKKIFTMACDDAFKYVIDISSKVVNKILVSLEHRAERSTSYTISYGADESFLGKLIANKLFASYEAQSYKKINIIVKIKQLDMDIVTKITKVLEQNNKINIYFVKEDNSLEYLTEGIRVYNNTNSNENQSYGRMVVSSTSINLARLGLKYQNKNINDFYEELSTMCELVKNELLLSFETIGSKSKEYYRALFKGNILDDEKLEDGQKIRKVIKNGVLNIGLIGLKECVICLEKDDVKRQKLINKIIDYVDEKCLQYTKDTKLNFGLYEPTSKTARTSLLAIDKAIYGMVTDVTDKKRYDLLDVDIVGDLSKLAEIQKRFSSGKSITFNLSNKLSIKKVADTLEQLKTSGVEFATIVVGKNEY